MAFCHNCGTQHGDGDMFCQNCGAKLTIEKQACALGNIYDESLASTTTITESIIGSNQWLGPTVRVAAQFTQIVIQGLFDVDFGLDFFKSNGESKPSLRGVLMTNVVRLSERFLVAPQQIWDLINAYTNALRKCGVDYTILDISCEECGDSWTEHARVLTELHATKFKGAQQPIFLFILGGDDIIPMPVIDNTYYHARVAAGDNNYRDKDIDSDLPYSYLLGEYTQNMLYKGELFNYKPFYCVGRLPFAEKCDISVLINYLKRAVDSHAKGGIKVNSTYAQTFNDWRNESYITSSVMNSQNLLLPYSQKISEQYTFHNLLTSPGVVNNNVQSLFNTNATLLFFNMHGSDNPMNPNFMGNIESFSPKQLESLNDANIIVTEACYGAKFKDLDTPYSMLLTALSNKTLVYFGSSRIALGGGGYTYEKVEDLMSADLYFKYLLDALVLGGFPVAYSVEYARAHYIKSRNRLELKDMLTIAEFNLYGDPTLRSYMGNDNDSPKVAATEEMKIAPLAEGKPNCGFNVETLYEKRDNSILSLIRDHVDSSLKQIVDTVNRELYDQFGLKPRDLSTVTKCSYKDGSSNMEFVYSTVDKEQKKIYVVNIEDGISKVLISK